MYVIMSKSSSADIKKDTLGALCGEKWRGAQKPPCCVLRHATVSKHRRPHPLCFDWTCQNNWQKAQHQLPNISIMYCVNSTAPVVKNANYYYGKLRKKQTKKETISKRYSGTLFLELHFFLFCTSDSSGLVSLANGLWHSACGRKSVWAPVLLSLWSSVSIPPVSQVVFALQSKKEKKNVVVLSKKLLWPIPLIPSWFEKNDPRLAANWHTGK